MRHRSGIISSPRAAQRDLIQLKFSQAAALHQAGDLSAARLIYDQIILADPSHFDALQLSALLAYQSSRFDDAETFFIKAITVRSDHVGVHSNYGLLLRDFGRFEESLGHFDKAISIKAGTAELFYNRGFVLQKLSRFDEAVTSYDKAIAIKGDYAEAYSDRGFALYALGFLDRSIASYDRAIAIRPAFAEAYSNRGNALIKLRMFDEAINSFKHALTLNPRMADAHSNLGNALNESQRFDEALDACSRAISINPDHAEAYCNRGRAFNELGRYDQAIIDYANAIRLKPLFFEAYENLGISLHELKRFDEAIASNYKAASLRPNDPKIYYHMSFTLLLVGNYQDGFEFYEWRKKLEEPHGARAFAAPLWLGAENLNQKRILIHEEQGIGDVIQFCRYIKPLIDLGANIHLAVRSALTPLLTSLGDDIHVSSLEEVSGDFDFHCPLMSLPLAFGTDLTNIPAPMRYLRAEDTRIDEWMSRIGAVGFRIGVCWQGSIGKVDAGRSFPLYCFHALSKIPGVRLISLHKGDGEAQLLHMPQGMMVETLGEDFDAGPHAFLDTAAVMMCCDLVITSDTAIAHLAGALGVRTWVALKNVPDWRWLLDRDDSPWYPTIRLFRQEARGDWDGVFERMRVALLDVLETR